jgi:hypothetical protein
LNSILRDPLTHQEIVEFPLLLSVALLVAQQGALENDKMPDVQNAPAMHVN